MLVRLTSIFFGGVCSMWPVCCRIQTNNIVFSNDSWTMNGQSCEKVVNVEAPTSMLSLTALICLRTSSNFLLCSTALLVPLAKEQQQTAKRQNTISFIFSVSAAGTGSPKDAFRKIYWKCRQLCRLPFYTYP